MGKREKKKNRLYFRFFYACIIIDEKDFVFDIAKMASTNAFTR
jgi:hypothetical protein